MSTLAETTFPFERGGTFLDMMLEDTWRDDALAAGITPEELAEHERIERAVFKAHTTAAIQRRRQEEIKRAAHEKELTVFRQQRQARSEALLRNMRGSASELRLWPMRHRVCGIYAIRHTLTNREYIGQSLDVRERLITHFRSLRQGDPRKLCGGNREHWVEDFQRDGARAFEWRVLENLGPAATSTDLLAAEAAWIQKRDPLYNQRTARP